MLKTEYFSLISDLKSLYEDERISNNEVLEQWNYLSLKLVSLCIKYGQLTEKSNEENEFYHLLMKCSVALENIEIFKVIIKDELISCVYDAIALLEDEEFLSESGRYLIKSGRTGDLIIYDNKLGEYLTTDDDPLTQARHIAIAIYKEEKNEYNICGCELGYLAYAVYELSGGVATVNIYDKDEEIIEIANQVGMLGYIPDDNINVIIADSYENISDAYIRPWCSAYATESIRHVGFIISDRNILWGDGRYPEKGNPGIGGSEYEALLISRYLAKTYSEIAITIYHINENNTVPDMTRPVLVNSAAQAVSLAKEEGIELLIFLFGPDYSVLQSIHNNKMKSIALLNNYLHYYKQEAIDFLENCEYIVRLICVSEAMYHCYDQDTIQRKMSWINNMWNTCGTRNFDAAHTNIVTYVGGIYPNKGFHILAEAWKKVLVAVPDARLHVIGSGELYAKNLYKMGKYNIAEEKYEDSFIQFLTDDNGNLFPSVIFHGLMGIEKIDIIKQTAVGVVNPSGATETFCISAVEFEAAGVPVVTADVPGIHTTMIDTSTGLLIKRADELADAIIRLLIDKDLNNKMSVSAREFAVSEFSPEKLVLRWFEEITKIF